MSVTPRQVAKYLSTYGAMRCNCDLDNWSPTQTTGHSEVCRIHIMATQRPHDIASLIDKVREQAELEATT